MPSPGAKWVGSFAFFFCLIRRQPYDSFARLYVLEVFRFPCLVLSHWISHIGSFGRIGRNIPARACSMISSYTVPHPHIPYPHRSPSSFHCDLFLSRSCIRICIFRHRPVAAKPTFAALLRLTTDTFTLSNLSLSLSVTLFYTCLWCTH